MPSLGSLHGPSCHSVCRASASSGSEASDKSNWRLQRARGALSRCKNILVEEYAALDLFLNNYRPSSIALDVKKLDLKKKLGLERNVAKAERDVAKAELDVLKEEDATALQLAKAER